MEDLDISKKQDAAVNDIDFTKGDFPIFYAQEAVVGSSYYDFSLVFIQNSIRGKDAVASVTVPPAMAKQLASILQSNIERYEENFGEKKLTPRQGSGLEGGIS